MASQDQFYFDNESQDMLLACMCRHAEKFASVGPLVKPDYMWGISATRALAFMQDYHAEYGHYPTLQHLDTYIQTQCGREKEELYNDCHDYIQILKKVNTRDAASMAAIVTKFCRQRAVMVAIKQSAEMLRQGKEDFDYEGVMREALNVGRDFSDLGICYWDDAEKVIRKVTEKSWGVRTGYPLLDSQWINGWGPGWLVVPLAPPKSYKSTFCMNLALNMTTKGINAAPVPVFYYACEISAELTCVRGYCRQAGLSMKDMHTDKEKFIRTIKKKMEQDFRDKKNEAGQILVKTFPSKSAGISDIRAHALMASESFGVKPRVIFIDHAETVRPSKRVKDASDHRQQADIYTEARALGAELECVVVMPDRCNKETVQHPVPNMTSFQGAFQKAGEVDVSIGLCQTPEERCKNLIRYFVFLNRHGPAYGYYQGKVEDDKFKMGMDTELKYEEAMAAFEEEQKAKRGDRGRKNRMPIGKLGEEEDR